jgi:hypothetical protein
MSRNHSNWIRGYLNHTTHLEAPDLFHIWTAIATIAGALGGKCFFDMGHFKWKPSFFVVFVAPPGIATKSTTANVGMNLLRGVEGISFGPESCSWQAMLDAFVDAEKIIPEIGRKDSSINIVASELGTLLDPKNREFMDVLNDLWDGKDVPLKRRTRAEGEREIQSACLNFIGCTTPSWIQENFPQYAISGGFTSRTVFVWGDSKRQFVALPKKQMLATGYQYQREHMRLIGDLKQVAKISGEFRLTPEAETHAEEWYIDHWTLSKEAGLDRELYGGYISRKQAHIMKVAMVMSAAERSDKIITIEDLEVAKELVTALEPGFSKVFSAISDNREVHYFTMLVHIVQQHPQGIKKREVWRRLSAVMTLDQFEASLEGALAADYMIQYAGSGEVTLRPHRASAAESKVVEMPSRLVGPLREDSSTSSSDASTAESAPVSIAASH